MNDRKQEIINIIKVHKIIFGVCIFFVVSSIPVEVLFGSQEFRSPFKKRLVVFIFTADDDA